MHRALLLSCAVGLGLSTGVARAETRRVPAQYPTIQAAVDAAAPGDVVRVSRGRYCGATLTKSLVLEGRRGARIVGCATSPTIATDLRAGFFLPGSGGNSPASGSTIRGFTFDGGGVANANLEPLAFGVFARYASDLTIERNHFLGTVQAVTNTGGDRWRIRRNVMTGITVLDCTKYCTGGDAIVIALGRGALAAAGGDANPLNRPEDNVVTNNRVEGAAPDGFATFSLAGVLLLSADHTTLLSNRIVMRDNESAAAVGQGILVANACCGLATPFLPGSRFTTLAFNDVRRSEVGIVVDGSGGANTLGLVLHRNRGAAKVEGAPVSAGALRVIGSRGPQPTL